MKAYSQLQKFISVLMIFILLIQLSGCVSYRIISNSDISDYSKYNHLIRSHNSKFPLKNVVVSQGLLSGKVNFSQSHNRTAIQVYPISDSAIEIDTANILSLPLDGIAKVKVPKVYLTKDYVPNGPMHKNKSKENKPIGKILLVGLYMCVGASLVYSMSMYIENHRHH
jgi:hypothetical protein